MSAFKETYVGANVDLNVKWAFLIASLPENKTKKKILLVIKFQTQDKRPRCLFNISKLGLATRFSQHPSVTTSYRV